MIDALKLMRIPFSIFLMPVFWFSLSNIETIQIEKAVLIFFILHILVYPASNGYNSYFDRDEGSIGGLKNPPKVNQFLFPLVVSFDSLAIILSLLVNVYFSILILIYLLVSKAYSYDKIRLKKYPIVSTLVVILFQGFFIFMTIQLGMDSFERSTLTTLNLGYALCSSIFLLGSYPLTQVYQHEEDKKRNDFTISILLGIKGTFLFSSIIFLIGTLFLSFLLLKENRTIDLLFFIILGTPLIIFFSIWFNKVIKNETNANFENTMKMNTISSISLSTSFILMVLF